MRLALLKSYLAGAKTLKITADQRFATEGLCLAEFVLKILFGIGQIKYSDQVITPRTTEFPAADQK